MTTADNSPSGAASPTSGVASPRTLAARLSRPQQQRPRPRPEVPPVTRTTAVRWVRSSSARFGTVPHRRPRTNAPLITNCPEGAPGRQAAPICDVPPKGLTLHPGQP